MEPIERVESLSDKRAVIVLSDVATTWLNTYSVEASGAILLAALEVGNSFTELPRWVLHSGESEEDSGNLARSALQAILLGRNDEASGWVVAALRRADESVGQIIDPISLSILGVTLIGSILAARVRKAGPVTFYEGVPKELADVIKAGAGAVGGVPGVGGDKQN